MSMIFGETILLEQGSVIWKYPCKIEAAHKKIGSSVSFFSQIPLSLQFYFCFFLLQLVGIAQAAGGGCTAARKQHVAAAQPRFLTNFLPFPRWLGLPFPRFVCAKPVASLPRRSGTRMRGSARAPAGQAAGPSGAAHVEAQLRIYRDANRRRRAGRSVAGATSVAGREGR